MLQEVNACAIAARDADRARIFADEYGFEKFYGSYEEMPHAQPLTLMKQMDECRRQFGLVYPGEE